MFCAVLKILLKMIKDRRLDLSSFSPSKITVVVYLVQNIFPNTTFEICYTLNVRHCKSFEFSR